MKVSIAWPLRLKEVLLKKKMPSSPLTVDELELAETEIIKNVQRHEFSDVISRLNNTSTKLPKSSTLKRLNPVLFEGVLRIGGRIEKAPIEFDIRHPIILPADHHVTKLIIENHHQEVGHSGMASTWASLRHKYWVIKGAITVRKILGNCVFCKKRNRPADRQIMTELGKERVTPNHPPFYFTGVDYFGPFYVKQGRSSVKYYGCLFTCLTMRAVNIKVAPDLSTSAFINALRRFFGRRGKPRKIISDNGTNFVGADKELKKAMSDLEDNKIKAELRQRHIEWQFNPPYASHMGGVWERLIRSIRKILRSLLSHRPSLMTSFKHS